MPPHKGLTPQTKRPVPPGWTYGGIDDSWDYAGSIGPAVAKSFGLGPVQPILEDKYGIPQIIQSGDKSFW
ncbi:hypothetical protein N7533_001127 [Penicillium manginii]|uniref:uncharacterized protein n=1 Tax=Penicillium manginii TaxID=203109 RepID=UPI0025482995|nr:uncharacterized protein N7533_001127 [Penicillium manginii]KAJ5768544.1 hypothetical protein N7533_001127 [Penicillium manginii]